MSGRSENEKTITHKVQTGGEITVNLILTIKLEGNQLSVSSAEATPVLSRRLMQDQLIEQEDEDVDLIVPDIQAGGLIQFGKKLEQEKQ